MSLPLTPGLRVRARYREVAVTIFCLWAVVFPVELPAQAGSFEVNAGASYSLPPASVSATETPYLNLGARLLMPIGQNSSWFLAGASGLSLKSDGASWISAVTGANWSFVVSDPVYIDLAASAEMFSVGEPYPYRAALIEGEPAVRLELGATTLRFAGWGGAGQSRVRPVSRPPGGSGGSMHGPDHLPEIATDLWSWGGRLEGYYRVGGTEPRASAEAYTSPQGDYLGGRVGIRFALLRSLWDLDFGVWDTPTGSDIRFSVGLIVPVGPDLSIRANGGRYGPDPLLDTPVAGSAGAVVSWTVSRFGEPRSELYDIVPGASPAVRFRVEAGEATAVTLVGGFTDWEEVAMVRSGDTWEVELEIDPGMYRYGFMVDSTWYVPEDADEMSVDEWGVPQATLIVPEP